ncbi:MAG TPA: type II secretion system protein M [Gammaproteobacteria bacterium]|nr:type II secretion system protein M [Gammaproteobacteria bacterium]
MKNWFANLQPRERMIVVVGGALAVLVVLWLAAISPFLERSAELRASVDRKQRLLVDLGRVAGAQQSRSTTGTNNPPQQTLYVLVDSTAKQHGLQVPRTRQEGPDGVNVSLQNAPFDALKEWLIELETTHAVSVESASISSAREQGLVNGQVFLRR